MKLMKSILAVSVAATFSAATHAELPNKVNDWAVSFNPHELPSLVDADKLNANLLNLDERLLNVEGNTVALEQTQIKLGQHINDYDDLKADFGQVKEEFGETLAIVKSDVDENKVALEAVQGDLRDHMNDYDDLKADFGQVKEEFGETLATVKSDVDENKVALEAVQVTVGDQGVRIDDLAESVKNVQTTLEANKADIATNKADIATNKADIATNKADIATNKADIATNKADIATTKANIATNRTLIEQYKASSDAQFKAVNSRIDSLDDKMKKGFASQAALNGLFQPYNVGKFNVSAAIGGYDSEQAMALGTGYRFNENFAIKAGVASDLSGFDHVTYNIGANFEF